MTASGREVQRPPPEEGAALLRAPAGTGQAAHVLPRCGSTQGFDQAQSRAAMQLTESFALPTGTRIRKISPLADWSAKDVWTYAKQHNIPLLSLYDKGYSSIGCEPCTSLPLDPNDPRSGRSRNG